MKRILFMVAMVAMIAGLAISASAESYLPIEGIYTVEYQDEAIVNGAQYGFVVIEGIEDAVLDLSEANLSKVLYIDQTAAANGMISFDAVGLKGALPGEEGFVGGTAFIGGEGLGGTAKEIGILTYQEEIIIPVASVEVAGPTEVEEGKTITLAATVLPADATNPAVVWSSNSANATVDANGVVTGVTAGTATITATADGVSATYEVTVKAAATTVKKGDVNGDNKVNSKDCIYLLDYLTGDVEEVFANPDVNGDSKTNSKDVIHLLDYLTGDVEEIY